MNTNITSKLDADLLGKVRVLAAKQGRTVSAYLTERFEEMVRGRQAFDKAPRRALARLRERLDLHWTPVSRQNPTASSKRAWKVTRSPASASRPPSVTGASA